MSSRGELQAQLTLALRELRGRLLQVNQAVGSGAGLAPAEMELLDLVARESPVTPGRLSELSGVNPATITGLLDRLEERGWIRRERDAQDRRRVFVHVLAARAPELGERFGPMLRRLIAIYGEYSDEQLGLLLEFVQRVRDAGEQSVAELRLTTREG